MKILVGFIFLLLFGLTEEKPQRQNDAKTQSDDSVFFQKMQESDSVTLRLYDCVSYFKSQIYIADSLYKNYLPQYNFEEVKASVEFFDSIRESGNHEIQNSLNLEFLNSRAHYYHAVGLTEKNHVVGACEHYLLALEIMEEMMTNDKRLKAKVEKTHSIKKTVDGCPLSVGDSEDYDKIKFVALIYTRLGQLFYNENYCELAILQYKQALKYIDVVNDTYYKAVATKFIANAYQLSNNADSAMYYYNISLNANINISNKLDIEKNIAQILFDKGEKDSAYIILKNNLIKINNENVKYSYHYTLGDMFYIDKKYDSAIYYLETCLDDSVISKRIGFTTTLSAIYDSTNNYEKRSYYDNISSKLFVNNINNEVNRSKLQTLYEEYNERKRVKIKIKTQKRNITLSCIVLIIVMTIIITIKYQHKKHSEKLSELIKEKDQHIKHNEFKNALIEGKIKSKNAELQQKDQQIKSQQLKINELQCRLENRKDNLKEYYQSEICAKILNKIDELSKSHKMTSELEPLSQEEFVILLQSANLHLGEFIKNISNRYPSFKKDDFYYLCLVALNLKDKQIAALFNVTYNAIRSRRKKICTSLGIDINENIYKKLII